MSRYNRRYVLLLIVMYQQSTTFSTVLYQVQYVISGSQFYYNYHMRGTRILSQVCTLVRIH